MKLVVRCQKCGRPAPQRAGGKRCANCDHPFDKPAGIDRRLDGKPAFRQMWLSMLVHIQRERGYSKTWAEVTFAERFGSWPEKGLSRDPVLPSPEVSYWVQNRNRNFRTSGEARKASKERRKQKDLDKRRHEESVACLSQQRRKELGFDIASPRKGRNSEKQDRSRNGGRAPAKQ